MYDVNAAASFDLGWFLVIVSSRSEKKVAALLERAEFEVFLPLERSERKWSDRVKLVDVPLFSCNLFCRCEPKQYLKLIHTPGVCGRPIPIPNEEIARLKKIISVPYRKQVRDIPTGSYTTVRLTIDPSISAELITAGTESEIVVTLDAVGQAIGLTVPCDELILLDQA